MTPIVIPDDPLPPPVVGGETKRKFTCTPGKDGSRLLTLDSYVVSFTNSVGGGGGGGKADDAAPMSGKEAAQRIAAQGGFQSAKTMVVPANKAERVKDKTAKKPVGIMLDETQTRIAKLDINKPLLIVAGAG
ncbi:hypothetical protein GGI23_003653, partial [Coemansia sp. RSA 2559]